jgi:hypothetical protein
MGFFADFATDRPPRMTFKNLENEQSKAQLSGLPTMILNMLYNIGIQKTNDSESVNLCQCAQLHPIMLHIQCKTTGYYYRYGWLDEPSLIL